jgi:molecular chaperone GrpE
MFDRIFKNMKNKEDLVAETEEIVSDTDIIAETEETIQPDLEVNEVSETDKVYGELAEMKDKYLRLYSEFDNFRRRTAKEKIDMIQNASEGLIKDLLPVVDDFERAYNSLENATEVEPIKEGISLIFNKLQRTLAAKGLKAMEARDQDFDVELHECITQFAAGEDKKGKVIDEVEKGYLLNDKVIRYAKVVVGS